MQFVLFETPEIRKSLLPFSAIRSVADLRIGMHTIRERWERILKHPVHCLTEEYLEEDMHQVSNQMIFISSDFIPDSNLINTILQLKISQSVFHNEKLLAFSLDKMLDYGFDQYALVFTDKISYRGNIVSFKHPHEIVQLNAAQLKTDIIQENVLNDLPEGVINQGASPLIIEVGAKIEPCYINTEDGPVFIGKNVLIMGGSQLRGPLALLEGSVVKMGSQIYGGTTIGKHCVVGGEIKNTIMMDYSNKAHGGYLGDSLIGSWCNIGAGTSCSNLKNTTGEVRVWSPGYNDWTGAGMKCGVMMGDYARSAINTSFNTGMVIGIGSQVICKGLTPKYIPDFTWNTETNERYQTEKFIDTAAQWMRLKQKLMTEKERRVLLRLLSK